MIVVVLINDQFRVHFLPFSCLLALSLISATALSPGAVSVARITLTRLDINYTLYVYFLTLFNGFRLYLAQKIYPGAVCFDYATICH